MSRGKMCGAAVYEISGLHLTPVIRNVSEACGQHEESELEC